jgi:hypothetical protein
MYYTGGQGDMYAGYWWVNLKEIDQVEVYGRIILKTMLKK